MIQEILIKILVSAVQNATPAMRQALLDYLDEWEAKAKTTTNPFDDLLILILKALIGV